VIFPALTLELQAALEETAPDDRRFCLFGSSVMLLHGLRDRVGDVDMFVTRGLYEVLKRRGWDEQRPSPFDPPLLERYCEDDPPAHAFYAWKKRGMPINVPELLYDPRTVQGWPVQPLQQLCMWKASIAHHSTRQRDWDDVSAIAQYLSRT
jgi:hypothetical protein